MSQRPASKGQVNQAVENLNESLQLLESLPPEKKMVLMEGLRKKGLTAEKMNDLFNMCKNVGKVPPLSSNSTKNKVTRG